MTFVVLFVIGMLAYPIILDIRRYGRDNILRRSGQDILEFRLVTSTLAMLGDLRRMVSDLVAAIVDSTLAMLGDLRRMVSDLVAAIVGFLLLVVLAYVAVKILGYLGRLVFGG